MAPLPPTRERPQVFVAPTPGAPSVPGGPMGPAPRKRRWGRLLFFTFAVLFAVALGAFAASALIAKQSVDKLLTPKSADVRAAQHQLAAPLPGKPANFLILGSDKRAGAASTDRRSDTLLLARLDPQRKTISMLSFPRDLYVPIPGHGTSKINEAFQLGGAQLAVQTVKQLTGLDVNYIVVVSFTGFRQIVDTLGGVYVDVDRHYFNDNKLGQNFAAIDIPEGYQLLKGRQALAFARFRHTDSDFHRIARQQLLLTAMKKQVSTSDIAQNLPGLFDAINKNTDMATGGNGTISTRVVIDYMRLALSNKGVFHVQVEGVPATGPGGASIVQATPDQVSAAVNAFTQPDLQAQQQTANQVTSKTAAAGAGAAGQQSGVDKKLVVEVRNGNGIPGAAGQAAVHLRKLGYNTQLQTGVAGNADKQTYVQTVVQYVDAKNKATADAIGRAFPGAVVTTNDAANPTQADILVIVGKQTAQAAAQPITPGITADSNKVPQLAAAHVITDPRYGLRDMLALRGQVKMQVEYPTVREANSVFDSPARAYKIAVGNTIYDAYRIVAHTGGLDYWGVQAMTWPDPPLLADPTREVTRAGRTYQLFFNGTKLHIVAWHENGATYYVTNSVLDKLGNETMWAIAIGVKPLPRR